LVKIWGYVGQYVNGKGKETGRNGVGKEWYREVVRWLKQLDTV